MTAVRQSDPHPTFGRRIHEPDRAAADESDASRLLMSSGAVVGVLGAIVKKHAETIGELKPHWHGRWLAAHWRKPDIRTVPGRH
jgi:hypothetical protein